MNILLLLLMFSCGNKEEKNTNFFYANPEDDLTRTSKEFQQLHKICYDYDIESLRKIFTGNTISANEIEKFLKSKTGSSSSVFSNFASILRFRTQFIQTSIYHDDNSDAKAKEAEIEKDKDRKIEFCIEFLNKTNSIKWKEYFDVKLQNSESSQFAYCCFYLNETILEKIVNEMPYEDLKSLLLEKDKKGNTCLMLLIKKNCFKSMEILFKKIKAEDLSDCIGSKREKLNPEEEISLYDYFKENDKIISYIEMIKLFIEKVKEVDKPEESDDNSDVFFDAESNYDKSIREKREILEFAKEYFSNYALIDPTLETAESDQYFFTAKFVKLDADQKKYELSNILEHKSLAKLEQLFDLKLITEEDFKKFLKLKEHGSRQKVINFEKLFNNSNKAFLEFVMEKLKDENIEDYVESVNDFFNIFLNSDKDSLASLLNKMSDKLLKQVLTQRDSTQGMTILMWFCYRGFSEKLEVLLEKISYDELKKMLLEKDNKNTTPFGFIFRGHKNMVLEVLLNKIPQNEWKSYLEEDGLTIYGHLGEELAEKINNATGLKFRAY